MLLLGLLWWCESLEFLVGWFLFYSVAACWPLFQSHAVAVEKECSCLCVCTVISDLINVFRKGREKKISPTN